MTATELIAKLQTMPGELPVWLYAVCDFHEDEQALSIDLSVSDVNIEPAYHSKPRRVELG